MIKNSTFFFCTEPLSQTTAHNNLRDGLSKYRYISVYDMSSAYVGPQKNYSVPLQNP